MQILSMANSVFPDSSKKAETFSLCWRPFIAEETHAEIHLSEKTNAYTGMRELAERVIPNKGATGEDVNAPLCPLLPFVKRNLTNKLEMHLENSRLERKIVQ